jgi:hypothetical protein
MPVIAENESRILRFSRKPRWYHDANTMKALVLVVADSSVTARSSAF